MFAEQKAPPILPAFKRRPNQNFTGAGLPTNGGKGDQFPLESAAGVFGVTVPCAAASKLSEGF